MKTELTTAEGLKNNMKKVNILEIANNFRVGGTQKVLQIYCKYLDKNKFNIFACGLFEGGIREKYIKPNVKKILIANGNADKVIKFIKENKIDILHFHSFYRNYHKEELMKILEFCKTNGIKIIEYSAFSLFEKDIDGIIDDRIFVSKTNIVKYIWKYKNQLKNIKNYSYLYSPLDTEELEKHRLTKNEIIKIKNKYGIKSSDFVIGKLGRADIWKWSDEIIDVVPYLIKVIPNLKVVIRALPEQKFSKIKKMKIEDYFILLPETSLEKELTETYQVMDIMVHTSRIGECNSSALNEALFFGVPIITTSTDFMQFTVFDRDNGQVEQIEIGKNGFITNSITGMADKIIYLRNNKRARDLISKENIKKARELFAAKIIIKDFENIVLNKKTSGTRAIISEYKKKTIRDSFPRLLKINYTALHDYIRYVILKFYSLY